MRTDHSGCEEEVSGMGEDQRGVLKGLTDPGRDRLMHTNKPSLISPAAVSGSRLIKRAG